MEISLKALNIAAFALISLVISGVVKAQSCPVSSPASGTPIVLYTDIVSGPNTGGENNNGIYLSIFGKNFGSSGLGSSTKVFINNVEVKVYRSLGMARGRTDIQQITTQIGAIGNPAVGTPLSIRVNVDGIDSNLDKTFTVLPGNIYFVDPVNGVDTTTTNTGGTFTSPFKTVQKSGGVSLSFGITSASTGGAYGRVRAGDFIVLRGGTYTGTGFQGYFMQMLGKSGCAIGTNCSQGGGSSSGPITLMGYPGETAFIDRTATVVNGDGGGFSSADSARQALGFGASWNIINLKIESGYVGMYWRVVNSEMTALSCQISTLCRAGGVAGNGVGNFWVGNYIHDIYDKDDANTSLENHGIYIGGDGSYEIAYNRIQNIPGGNGIQTHYGNTEINNVSVHHNLINNVGKHGINLADGSKSNFVIWNNIIHTSVSSGLRMGGTSFLTGLKLYNNTFYNTNTSRGPADGCLANDMQPAANQVDIRNNICWPATGSPYVSGSNNPDFSGPTGGRNGIITNNLWFGSTVSSVPTFDAMPRTGNPLFASTSAGNFHLLAGSSAINAGNSGVSSIVVDDYDIVSASTGARTLRSSGTAYDIGAFRQ
jgi:hypothetical protein